MTDITFKDHVTATLLDVDGDERRIARRARVSTQRDGEQHEGLVRSLARERHGSPFESCKMTWEVEAPIAVAREGVRHRLSGWNEESGRYVQLRPIFYVPGAERHLVKVEGSKQMDYRTESGSVHQKRLVEMATKSSARAAWGLYQEMIDNGILKEVARLVLPVSIMTHWHWEMNVRALTNFLSLRIRHPQSHVESKPMAEIQDLAILMEHDFAEHFPTVYSEWATHGRLPL